MPQITARDLMHAAFEASIDAAIVVDSNGRIVISSPAVTTLFGYRPEELIGLPIETLVPESAKDVHVTHRESYLRASGARHMGSGRVLYGRSRDGKDVPIDASLVPVEVGGVRFSVALVHDASERLRSMRQAQAVSEIAEHLLGGAYIEDSLALIVRRARSIAESEAAWVTRRQSQETLRVVSADGACADALFGFEVQVNESLLGPAMAEGLPVTLDLQAAEGVPARIRELGLGPTLAVPLGDGDAAQAILVVARSAGEASFDDFDVNLVKMFAAATAVVLRAGDLRRNAEAERLVAEHERMSQFLIDSSIQKAFQIELILSSVRSMLAPRPISSTVAPWIVDRLDEAIGQLDDLIRDLRSAAFQSGDSAP